MRTSSIRGRHVDTTAKNAEIAEKTRGEFEPRIPRIPRMHADDFGKLEQEGTEAIPRGLGVAGRHSRSARSAGAMPKLGFHSRILQKVTKETEGAGVRTLGEFRHDSPAG